ncbi:MAG: DUF1073 domain-containing protein [Pseudomonadota bacterium]
MIKPHYRLTSQGSVIPIGDGMKNALTGLGGATDKGASNRHHLQIPSDYELTVIYETSWIGRQIVDIPVEDATKKWRTWGGDQGEEIAELEREFGIQEKVDAGAKSGRLFGGAALIVGAGDPDASQPLNYDDVTEIRYVNVVDRFDLSPGPVSNDVTSQRFGKPIYYTAQVGGSMQQIHPSRLCLFGGSRPSSRSFGAFLSGWDNSILVSKIDAIRDMDAVMAHIRSLVAEAKVEYLKIKHLTQRVQDPREEAALKAQLSILESTAGNRRRAALDTEEDVVSSTYSFAGMGDMVDRFMHMAAGAGDIPITRLFGASPGGLNSAGESDLANYYDSVAALQQNNLGPALRPLDMCLKASVGALDDDTVKPEWRPVREMSEKDVAEVQERTVRALVALEGAQMFGEDQLEPVFEGALRRVGLEGLEIANDQA